jgi:CRP-like cAMP-binding protein
MDGNIWYLKRCELFENLSALQAERLERTARLRHFSRRSLVYAPNEAGESVLLLVRGRIKIKDITPDGKEAILAFIEEGEIFGELALMENETRTDYAEVVEDAQVLLIPRDDFLWLMHQRPDIAFSITKLVGLRRKRIENRLRSVLFLSSRERMIRLLSELAEAYGERLGNQCAIRLPLSHQELASLIGVTRETVTVVLGQLQGEGLIQVKRRQIRIMDNRRLAAERDGKLDEPRQAAIHAKPIPRPSKL